MSTGSIYMYTNQFCSSKYTAIAQQFNSKKLSLDKAIDFLSEHLCSNITSMKYIPDSPEQLQGSVCPKIEPRDCTCIQFGCPVQVEIMFFL